MKKKMNKKEDNPSPMIMLPRYRYITNAKSSHEDLGLKTQNEVQSDWQADLFGCCSEPCLSEFLNRLTPHNSYLLNQILYCRLCHLILVMETTLLMIILYCAHVNNYRFEDFFLPLRNIFMDS